MDIIAKIIEYKDYFGAVVGLIILLISVFFLPSNVRWYVLSAGLGVFVYRVFQITINKKRLAEADAQRKQLRAEREGLKTELDKSKANLDELYKELEKVRSERTALIEEARKLKERSGGLGADYNRLNDQAKAIAKKNNELIDKVEMHENAVSVFDRAENAFKDMEQVH